MEQFTYLLINFCTVIVCFIFSFDRRIGFNKHFGAFIRAAIFSSVLFISWDVWFTHIGVWWFNYTYTIGMHWLGLPLEEWLFFICIPFSCIFTYYCIEKFINLEWAKKWSPYIVWFWIIVCLVALFSSYSRMYPLVTALVAASISSYLHFVAKINWLGKASIVYVILMFGFIPVNGILTGTGLESPIVNYNPDEILNFRVLTIPIEDFVFGYALFLTNLYFFKIFQHH
jgi:lycopene cyclase domain-containing protein